MYYLGSLMITIGARRGWLNFQWTMYMYLKLWMNSASLICICKREKMPYEAVVSAMKFATWPNTWCFLGVKFCNSIFIFRSMTWQLLLIDIIKRPISLFLIENIYIKPGIYRMLYSSIGPRMWQRKSPEWMTQYSIIWLASGYFYRAYLMSPIVKGFPC